MGKLHFSHRIVREALHVQRFTACPYLACLPREFKGKNFSAKILSLLYNSQFLVISISSSPSTNKNHSIRSESYLKPTKRKGYVDVSRQTWQR
jgi:hypothetical protein